MSDSKEMTVVERAALALGADDGEKALVALSQKYADITEIKNPAGRTQCHAAAMELGNARIGVDKTGKAAREDANALQKAVIAEAARRISIIKPEEDRLLALRDAWDAECEREKQGKAAAEKARIGAIRAKIDAMRNKPAEMVGKPSEEIGVAADHLSMAAIDLETYADLAGEAQVERNNAVKRLREMQETQMAHEAEQDRLAAERAELERLRAEAAERERVSAEARAEAERQASAAREREEAERRKRDVQERAERQRIDGIRERISQIKATVAMQAGKPSASIESAISALQSMDMSGFDEFHQEAGLAYGSTLDQLRDMFTSMQALEAQQAELARQQAEIDRHRAEQERRDREARELLEAQEREAEVEEAHQEALWEEARINAERHEAQRKAGEAKAAELDRLRRQQAEFEANGPEDWEIVQVIAAHYDVTPEVAKHWLGRHAWMEKAA